MLKSLKKKNKLRRKPKQMTEQDALAELLAVGMRHGAAAPGGTTVPASALSPEVLKVLQQHEDEREAEKKRDHERVKEMARTGVDKTFNLQIYRKLKEVLEQKKAVFWHNMRGGDTEPGEFDMSDPQKLDSAVNTLVQNADHIVMVERAIALLREAAGSEADDD